MMFSSDRILASSSDCLLCFSSICSVNCQTHPQDRRGDRQMRQTEEIDRQTDRETDTDRQTDRHRQRDRQTDRERR